MFEFTTFAGSKLDRWARALGVAPRGQYEPFDAFVARLRAVIRDHPERPCALVDAAIRDDVWEAEQPTAS